MTAVAASGFTFVSWWQSYCVLGRARPRTQHDCHHDAKVNPEAANAFIELLIMGGKTPETYWAVNKRQDNKLENCCIWLVIYLKWNISVWKARTLDAIRNDLTLKSVFNDLCYSSQVTGVRSNRSSTQFSTGHRSVDASRGGCLVRCGSCWQWWLLLILRYSQDSVLRLD